MRSEPYCRWFLAKSISDTAAMSQLWRGFRRWDALRIAASALGLAFVVMLGGYAFSAIESGVTPEGVAAAVVAVAIAGTGLLYAFRLGAGGLVD